MFQIEVDSSFSGSLEIVWHPKSPGEVWMTTLREPCPVSMHVRFTGGTHSDKV